MVALLLAVWEVAVVMVTGAVVGVGMAAGWGWGWVEVES